MPGRYRIQRISKAKLLSIIVCLKPTGLFICKEESCWIAVDNSTGNVWTEEFESKEDAVRWLNGQG